MPNNRKGTILIGILSTLQILLLLHAHWHHTSVLTLVIGWICVLIGLATFIKCLVIDKVIRIETYKEDWTNMVQIQITPDIYYSYLKYGSKKDWRYGFLQCSWFNRGFIVYFLNPDDK